LTLVSSFLDENGITFVVFIDCGATGTSNGLELVAYVSQCPVPYVSQCSVPCASQCPVSYVSQCPVPRAS
jgi:hypothetical protein